MHVVIVYNPGSGRGRAERLAGEAGSVLRRAGHTIETVAIERERSDRVLGGKLDGAHAMVVVGGDGTVRWAVRAAEQSGVPIYQMPTGTENLFAREFGMSAHTGRMLAAVEAQRVRAVDVGVCNSRRFLIMVGVGLDGGVIHRLEQAREGSISHLSYSMPIVREALTPHLGPVRIEVDGREVLDGAHGTAIVCNSSQYGARFDPGRDAVIDDGELDVVFLPGRTTLGIARWGVLAWFGRHVPMRDHNGGRVVYERGRSVVIEGDPARCPVQYDGEAFTEGCGLGRGPGRVEIGVVAGALRVLVPRDGKVG